MLDSMLHLAELGTVRRMNEQGGHVAECCCGKVALLARGRAIAAAVCYCASCRQFRANPPNGSILDADGGTAVVLYRKDRVRCLKGEEYLDEHRLQALSKTRRVVATCCGTPMFLDFEPGYWMSVYRSRFGDSAPSITMKARSGRFMLKLLASWIAMGFQSPKFTWSRG
jgi:hypothetical protein